MRCRTAAASGRTVEAHASPVSWRSRNAAVRSWTPPTPTDTAPEAEWGYLDELDDDILAFANTRGHAVRRLTFEEPQDLSAIVADVHMRWLRRRGVPPVRLIAENFALVAPWDVLGSGAVPFWLPFNTEPGDTALSSLNGLREKGASRRRGAAGRRRRRLWHAA